MCITVKVNVYMLGKKGGSDRVRVLGPDPTRRYCQYSGPDPTQPDPTRPARVWTRPAVFVNIQDPTRPNPTRPDPRVDPTREQLCYNPLYDR